MGVKGVKGVKGVNKPRQEVLQGELQDAIFAADFGHVVEGRAPDVYQDPATFFRNTHPARNLCEVVGRIFEPLSDRTRPGLALRLSTGFGGGKTHTLIALWHLARNIGDVSLGTELLPAAGRPRAARVAAFDGDKAGTDVCVRHPELITHSLFGEIAYQLGGPEAYHNVEAVDDPEKSPDAALVRSVFPQDEPVLILLDELIKYLPKLSPRGRDVLLAFISLLVSEVQARPQTVLVITDPGEQGAYEITGEESDALRKIWRKLDEELDRKTSHYDPIGAETSRVVTRRLFESIDQTGAQKASAMYHALYERIRTEHPNLVPDDAPQRAKQIPDCYPFHPRLIETARDRLGSIQDFQKSRGVLRLFARIIRDIWSREEDPELINEGDVNWSDGQLQADLLERLGRSPFKAAISADIEGHAAQLDEEHKTDVHRRVASALLLESLLLQPNAAMDAKDVTLAVARPSDAGNEAEEALQRLIGVCWHTYPDSTGTKVQFRYEPNVNAQIDERARQVPRADAEQSARSLAQNYFQGVVFKLRAFPASPDAVPDSPELKLVLSESEQLAQDVCDYESLADPQSPVPRGFRNAILGVAATPDLWQASIDIARRLMAARRIAEEHRGNTQTDRMVREQLEGPNGIIKALERRTRLAVSRAFNRVVFQGRPPVTLPEKYLVSEETVLTGAEGQKMLQEFLRANNFIYEEGDVLDVDLLMNDLVSGATPSVEHTGAVTAKSVHERALRSPRLRLMRTDSPVRRSILKAVDEGRLLVRMPDGSVYDREGLVAVEHGERRRMPGRRISTLSLEETVLLAPSDAPCAEDWTKVEDGEPRTLTLDEAAKKKNVPREEVERARREGLLTTVEQDGKLRVVVDEKFRSWLPGGADGPREVYNWDEAVRLAESYPLASLELSVPEPGAAPALLTLAQPFSARGLSLSVTVEVRLKDGGRVEFVAEGVRPNHPLQLLETARKLWTAGQEEDRYYKAALSLDFGEEGREGADGLLRDAHQNAPDGVDVVARFTAKRT